MAAVLIVDDEVTIARAVGRVLARAGHAVTLAEGLPAAETLVARERFDVVITDYRMPGGSGVALLRRLHALQPWAGAILFTGLDDVPPDGRGPWRVLHKPCDNAALLGLVAGLSRGARA